MIGDMTLRLVEDFLPEKGVAVLVQCGHPEYKKITIGKYVGLKDASSPYCKIRPRMENAWDTGDAFMDCLYDFSIVAWMPLPKPLKISSEKQ